MNATIPYDELWKDVLEGLYPDFVQFFLPDFAEAINWARKYVFLDKELSQISPKSKGRKRFVDKLTKVYLKDGHERWVLVHVEIQGYRDEEFAERMFIYFYRIYDKFKQKIISVAVFSDSERGFKPDRFSYSFLGCDLEFRYRTYKILEYSDEELEKSENPFALVVLAAKRSLESRNDEEKRFVFKWELIRLLLRKGYDRTKVIQVFRFLDGVLALSDEMKEELIYEEFHREEVERMPYITSWERIAIRRGMKEGMEKGMEKGMLEGVSEMVLEALEERFGKVPEDVRKAIVAIENKDELKKLFKQAMRVSNLGEFQLSLG